MVRPRPDGAQCCRCARASPGRYTRGDVRPGHRRLPAPGHRHCEFGTALTKAAACPGEQRPVACRTDAARGRAPGSRSTAPCVSMKTLPAIAATTLKRHWLNHGRFCMPVHKCGHGRCPNFGRFGCPTCDPNIGLLTDIEPSPPPLPYRAGHRRRRNDPGGAGQAAHQLPQVARTQTPAGGGGQQRPGQLPPLPRPGALCPVGQVGLRAATVAGVSGTFAFRPPLRTTRSTRWPESSPRSAMSAAQASSTRKALCSSSRTTAAVRSAWARCQRRRRRPAPRPGLGPGPPWRL